MLIIIIVISKEERLHKVDEVVKLLERHAICPPSGSQRCHQALVPTVHRRFMEIWPKYGHRLTYFPHSFLSTICHKIWPKYGSECHNFYRVYISPYTFIRLLLQKFVATTLIPGLQVSDKSIAWLPNSYWNRWRWKRRFWPCPVVCALCLTLYMRSGQPRWPGWLGPSSPCQIFKYLDMKGEYIWSKVRLKEISKLLQFVAMCSFFNVIVTNRTFWCLRLSQWHWIPKLDSKDQGSFYPKVLPWRWF